MTKSSLFVSHIIKKSCASILSKTMTKWPNDLLRIHLLNLILIIFVHNHPVTSRELDYDFLEHLYFYKFNLLVLLKGKQLPYNNRPFSQPYWSRQCQLWMNFNSIIFKGWKCTCVLLQGEVGIREGAKWHTFEGLKSLFLRYHGFRGHFSRLS